MRPSDSNPGMPLRVYLLVAAVLLAGTWTLAAQLAVGWSDGLGDPLRLLLCLAGLILVNAFRTQFSWKGQSESVRIDEVFFVVLAVTSTPTALALAMLAVGMIASIRDRQPLIKALFNAGTSALSVAAALVVMSWMDRLPPLGDGALAMATASVGAVTLHAVQTIAVGAVIAVADALPVSAVWSRFRSLDVVLLTCAVSMGLLAALVSLEHPFRLLLVMAPLTAVLVLLRGHADLLRERAQLDQLLTTAVSASRATGVDHVSAVLAEATRRLLHTSTAAVRTEPPGPQEDGARIDVGQEPLWLVASGHSQPPKQAADLLGGVAAIGAGAIGSAQLVETIRRHELFDPLTGLPNRVLLQDRVGQALEHRALPLLALLHLDADHFKRINDNLGRAAGDEALQEIGRRIVASLRPGDSAARVSGDEFAVAAPVHSAQEAMELAEHIRAAVGVPLLGSAAGVVVTVSTGVALAPADGQDFPSLLHAADRAMRDAKASGRDAVSRTTSTKQTVEGLGLEGALRAAIGTSQIWVAYQPQVDLGTLRLVGAEALVRWTHPERGLLRPDQFLPMADEAGLLGALDLWMLEQACRQTAAWRQQDGDLRVAVNLSAGPLRSGRLHEQVLDTLLRSGLPAQALEVEVTENVVGAEHDATIETLSQLRALGVTVAIDDFGTGYSSLSRLQRLPVDVLKIDQSFVREITSESTGMPLITSTIGMAHGLGLQVVAEGIETPEQLRFLTRAGCRYGQGYLLGRPMEADALTALLGQGQPEVSAASTHALKP